MKTLSNFNSALEKINGIGYFKTVGPNNVFYSCLTFKYSSLLPPNSAGQVRFLLLSINNFIEASYS